MSSKGPRITVSGDAVVRVVPDEVVLTLGVETHEASMSQARRSNDAAIAGLIALTERYAVPARDVRTDYMHLEPRFKDSYDRRTVTGYSMRKTLVVTLHDLGVFEALMAEALEKGATHLHGADFRTTELRRHRDEARRLALLAAHEKARDMAEVLGQRIGNPLRITEEGSWWSSGYGSWWGGHHGHMSQNVVQQASADPAVGDSIAPGTIAVSARVTVAFELVPGA